MISLILGCVLLLPNPGYCPSGCQELLPPTDIAKRLAELEDRLTRIELLLEVIDFRYQAKEEEKLIAWCTAIIKKQPFATKAFFDELRQMRMQSHIRLRKLNDAIKERNDTILRTKNNAKK